MILPVSPCSQEQTSVYRLYRKHSATLGNLPNGAFEEYAEKGGLWYVPASDASAKAYVAFRISRGVATLAHLCVASEHRGEGLAKGLFAHLMRIAVERGLRGIRLSCRHDYREANQLWQTLGLVAVSAKTGRGKDAMELTIWWFDLGNPDLFSISGDDSKLRVAMDMNVLIDLHDTTRPRHHESMCLKQNWLEDFMVLGTLPETWNEINRAPDESIRTRSRGWARHYESFTAPNDVMMRHHESLLPIFGHTRPDPNQESDLRQLAYALAAGVEVFLTYDDEMLRHSHDIEALNGLRIQHPIDLVTELDLSVRGHAYQPARLAGTEILDERITPDRVEVLVEEFAPPQRAPRFRDTLRELIAQSCSEQTDCRLITASGRAECLMARHSSAQHLDLRLLRIGRSPLARTIARHVLHKSLMDAASAGKSGLRVTDQHLAPHLSEVLPELGFISHDGVWVKPTLSTIAAPATLAAAAASTLKSLGIMHAPTLNPSGSPEAIAAFEFGFWPAKVTKVPFPTYIIPIEPHWARMLFDADSAAQDLFHEKWNLILNRENVYYSGAVDYPFQAPARILWYVSSRRNERFARAIRACSRLIAVDRDTPKNLHRRHKHLGIFEYQHVEACAKRKGHAVALRFADTELFSHSVSYEDTRRYGITSSFPGPLAIDSVCFETIYRHGTGRPA